MPLLLISINSEKELTEKYPGKYFRAQFQTSELLNLQLADQICGVFYQLMPGGRLHWRNPRIFDIIPSSCRRIHHPQIIITLIIISIISDTGGCSSAAEFIVKRDQTAPTGGSVGNTNGYQTAIGITVSWSVSGYA